MFSQHLSSILNKLAAACSGLSYWVGQGSVRATLQVLQPQAILRIEGLRTDPRLVALKINDSASAETDGILDLLREHDATAKFFVHGAGIRGTVEEWLLRRIPDEGHEVGNHMPESVPSVQLKPCEFAEEFERNHRILLEYDADPARFRPYQSLAHADGVNITRSALTR